MPSCQLTFQMKKLFITPHLAGSLDSSVPSSVSTVLLLSSMTFFLHHYLPLYVNLGWAWIPFFNCESFCINLIISGVCIFQIITSIVQGDCQFVIVRELANFKIPWKRKLKVITAGVGREGTFRATRRIVTLPSPCPPLLPPPSQMQSLSIASNSPHFHQVS